MIKAIGTLFIYIITCFAVSAQIIDELKLVSGPMQGHTTSNATYIWLMVKNAETVAVHLKDTKTGATFTRQQTTADNRQYQKFTPLTFRFNELEPARTYQLQIEIDNKMLKKDFTISTFSDDTTGNFSFLLGSCALHVPWSLRWMHPGIEEWIYPSMKKTEGDFMLWLGDYLYYLPKNYKSPEGMFERQILQRTRNLHMDFMRSRPQYSIWDDHEYGHNNANKYFKFKNESLELHRLFWPNPQYGTPDNPGVYFSFSYKDADFFMTDCRFYRTEELIPNATMFGEKQLQWLMDGLRKSKATFKFVGVGTQMLNPISANESFYKYPEEYRMLMDFLLKEKITGVIFLTGDRHHSELIKINRPDAYPLYDFTSSAITTFRRKTSRSGEKNNPFRVPGTLYDRQNFGRIAISGTPGNRVCQLQTFNNRGKLVWEVSIGENELKYFKSPE
jgi:alkaline phosphatase D